MIFNIVKIPLIIKKLFPSYVWEFSLKEKVIYLTFDDGPTPEITEWTLKTLDHYNAKATFFCIGENVIKHPEIFNSILKNGHSIGNHTQNHLRGWKTSTETYIKNTEKAQSVINLQIKDFNKNSKQKLFRPPYGQITPKQGKKLRALGYKIMMWTCVAFDWDDKVTPAQCLKNITSKTTAGNIVVFHDSVKASKNMQYALPKVLDYFSKKGYAFKAIGS
ncbi:polysaccharide deacetylase family protein [Lacinutrix salivirga]